MLSVPSARSPSVSSAPSFEPEGRRLLYFGSAGLLILIAFCFAAWSNLRGIFSSVYLSHTNSFLGSRGLLWSHAISDLLIGLSLFAISITLAYLISYKGRHEMPFRWMFLAFGLFIVASALTHLIEVVTVWTPIYVLAAGMKGFTAAVSLTTAAVLPFIIPQIFLMNKKAKESEELRRMNGRLEGLVQKRMLELAKANEELKTSERKYRLLFESNPMSMWVFDRDSLKFLAVNEAAIRHYGYSRDEFLAMTIADIRPEEDIPRLPGSVSNRVPGLNGTELWRHRKKDGTVIQVEITSHPIPFAGKTANWFFLMTSPNTGSPLKVSVSRKSGLSRHSGVVPWPSPSAQRPAENSSTSTTPSSK